MKSTTEACRWGCDSGLDLVFHAIALALDEDGFGVMKEAIEECRGERRIVIEDLRSVLVGAIGRDDHGAMLVAPADDLEE